jgi:hypothetical protein
MRIKVTFANRCMPAVAVIRGWHNVMSLAASLPALNALVNSESPHEDKHE